jgi:hypothetical protein
VGLVWPSTHLGSTPRAGATCHVHPRADPADRPGHLHLRPRCLPHRVPHLPERGRHDPHVRHRVRRGERPPAPRLPRGRQRRQLRLRRLRGYGRRRARHPPRLRRGRTPHLREPRPHLRVRQVWRWWRLAEERLAEPRLAPSSRRPCRTEAIFTADERIRWRSRTRVPTSPPTIFFTSRND